jgi:thermitase
MRCSFMPIALALSAVLASQAHAASDLIVKLKPGAERSSAFSAFNAAVGAEVASPSRLLPRLRSITLPEGVDADQALALYRSSDLVEYAEPNAEVRLIDPVGGATTQPESAASMDDRFGEQWALHNTGQNGGVAGVDIGALKAWEITRGSRQVIVAVLDSGVDYTHPDLAANMWINEGEIPADGIDNDRNGYVDDVRGWDAFNGDNDPMDDGSHGTYCAGIIAAAHDDRGVMGVAGQVRIMPVKGFGPHGSTTLEPMLKAIEYAILNGADILSNSWVTMGRSQALEDLIEEANRREILVVAGAGNSRYDNDKKPFYPASYAIENIISVAAIDSQGMPAGFTNFGAKSVHLAAPGVEILSTVPNGSYYSASGTSAACPQVAGAAALLKAHTGLSHLEIKKRLLETARKTPVLFELISTAGYLDVYRALTGIPAEPLPPGGGWTQVKHRVSHPKTCPKTDLKWEIHQPGAKAIRVRFSRMNISSLYDVNLRDGDGKIRWSYWGKKKRLWSREVRGDRVIVHLEKSSGVDATSCAFEIDSYKYR